MFLYLMKSKILKPERLYCKYCKILLSKHSSAELRKSAHKECEEQIKIFEENQLKEYKEILSELKALQAIEMLNEERLQIIQNNNKLGMIDLAILQTFFRKI